MLNMQLDSYEIELEISAISRCKDAKLGIENCIQRIKDHEKFIEGYKETLKINEEILYWINKRKEL